MVLYKKAAMPPFLLAARYGCALALSAAAALAGAQTASPGTEDLDAARALLREGARELALTRIETLQPADSAAARWAEWESLRCEVLSALGRHEDLLKRAGALPPRTPDRLLRACLAGAARSALATGDPALARGYLARFFWRTDAPAAASDTREARLVVIDSYLAGNQSDEAYRLMLRYQQDYAPLGEAAAVRFTDALLAAGREKDAINWFAQLPDDAPARLRMRLRMGLATPEQTIVQARALAAKQPSVEGYWVALGEAAALQKNRTLQVEALEHGLDVANAREPARVARLAETLWKQYADLALEAANRAGLLKGDDARWSDYAARRFGPEPAVARALFAQLARTSASRETRFTSQLQLVTSLTEQNLGRTALRLFEDPRAFPVADLDPQVRYQLGRVAAASGRPALAAKLIEALPPPPAVSAEEWQVSLATVHLKAGNAERAAAELQKLAAGRAALPPGLITRAAALASELAEAGQAKAAVEVLRNLALRAEGAPRRDVLIAQARAAEAAADYRNAAAAWLDAAFVTPPANDVAGLRLRAAQALARAGLKEDARAQYDWLLKNTKDATTLDAARRDLQKL